MPAHIRILPDPARLTLGAVLLLVAASCDRPPSSPPGFTEIAAEAGIDFRHVIGATGELHFPEIMGSGCTLFDHDGDGDLDVYMVQGGPLDSSGGAEATPTNRLFRNDLVESGGTLRFVDVTDGSGAGDAGYGMGVATADYDNDGDIDLYLTNFGPDVLLRNEGNGSFTDVTADSGLSSRGWSMSATFLDYDNDGRLDLAVVAYNDFTLGTNKPCFDGSGRRDYCDPDAYLSVPTILYRNLGDGTFDDVTATTGIDAAYGHGLGILAADLDGNGWQDLYVANDGDANQLWLNDGGMFRDAGLINGAALNASGQAEAGMGIALADHDDDGDPDLFLTHLTEETHTLYENLGKAVFEDATVRHGIAQATLPFTGFGVGWFDADHDGDLDLFVANGAVGILEELADDPYPYHQRDQFLINSGSGRYEEPPWSRGGASEVSRGAAFGDIDNDGDIDILVSTNNGPARLLRNDLEKTGHWMLLRVIDPALGRDAIGARVEVTLENGLVLTRWVRTDGSYLSAGDPRVHIAWSETLGIVSARVILPDGRAQLLDLPAPRSIHRVETGSR